MFDQKVLCRWIVLCGKNIDFLFFMPSWIHRIHRMHRGSCSWLSMGFPFQSRSTFPTGKALLPPAVMDFPGNCRVTIILLPLFHSCLPASYPMWQVCDSPSSAKRDVQNVWVTAILSCRSLYYFSNFVVAQTLTMKFTLLPISKGTIHYCWLQVQYCTTGL